MPTAPHVGLKGNTPTFCYKSWKFSSL